MTASSGLELRIPPLLVTALVAAAMAGVSALSPGTAYEFPARPWLATLLAALGAGVALAGVVEFHRAGTTVNPVRTAAVRRVVTGGIYRASRNPMYLGFAFALTGWALWLANALALLGVPLLVAYLNRYQIAPEERLMRDRFGAEYEAYLAQVRRWIGRR